MHLWWSGRLPNFQAPLLFACAIAGALFPSGVEGAEFSGGRVTGPLLTGVNFVAPGAFEYLFSGDFRTRHSTGLVWDPAALAIIALMLVTTIVSLRRAPAGVV